MCVAAVKYSANLLPLPLESSPVATPLFPFPLTGHIIPLALVHHTLTYFCATMNQADVVVVVAISVLIGNHEGLLGLPALRALSFSPRIPFVTKPTGDSDDEARRNDRYSFHCGSKSKVRDYDRRAKCDDSYSRRLRGPLLIHIRKTKAKDNELISKSLKICILLTVQYVPYNQRLQKNYYWQTVKCRNNFQTEITGRVSGYSVSDESLPARAVTKQFFHSHACRKRWKGWR
ncbi:hypothetical protein ALC53_05738 [Atta colombica]|uniref:Uncharacterized protein n=1 Tax=Atta colombica TaxID=520822 RepID=A0A195BGU2_9HYME|nr:hypothetical protein ALC53_05738 [Atta colombica]